MPNFEIEMNKKFNELIPKMQNDNFKLNDLVELKSFIHQTYRTENYNEDFTKIKRTYNKIDFKI